MTKPKIAAAVGTATGDEGKAESHAVEIAKVARVLKRAKVPLDSEWGNRLVAQAREIADARLGLKRAQRRLRWALEDMTKLADDMRARHALNSNGG